MEKNHIKRCLEALQIFSKKHVETLGKVVFAIKNVRNMRISRIADTIKGNTESNRKEIQRSLNKLSQEDLSLALLSFVSPKDRLVLMDFTEKECPNAKNTEHVGILKDGKTRGYGILTLSIPFKGRSKAIFAKVISSATLNRDSVGKWQAIQHALEDILPILQGRTIIADREFSNEEMMQFFIDKGIYFCIRLKTSAGKHLVQILDKKGNRVNFSLPKGSKRYFKNVYYKGNLKVNIAAQWPSQFAEPMYVITNCSPKLALIFYKKRMKIEESFKDIKDKLKFVKLMNKNQDILEKLLMIGFLAYNIFLYVGEMIRSNPKNRKIARKFSGLHMFFYKPYSYTRSALNRAYRSLIMHLQQINAQNDIWLRSFRRA